MNLHCNAAEAMNLHIILNECYTKRHSAIKQADIRDMFKKVNKHVDPSPATLRSPSPQPGPSRRMTVEELLADDPLPVASDSE